MLVSLYPISMPTRRTKKAGSQFSGRGLYMSALSPMLDVQVDSRAMRVSEHKISEQQISGTAFTICRLTHHAGFASYRDVSCSGETSVAETLIPNPSSSKLASRSCLLDAGLALVGAMPEAVHRRAGSHFSARGAEKLRMIRAIAPRV